MACPATNMLLLCVHLQYMRNQEVLNVLKVAFLCNGVVVIAIGKLFPYNRRRATHSHQLFHVRWSGKVVSLE